MKLSIMIFSSFFIACHALENSKLDDVQYKNHKPSTRSNTENSTYKHTLVYSAPVYTDLSNINKFTTVTPTEQSKTITESPMDAVRVFITPLTGKRKQDPQPVVITTQTSIGSSSVLKTTNNWDTAKSVVSSESAQKEKKSLNYLPVASTTSNAKVMSDFRPTVIATDNEPKYINKSSSNGTAKMKNASKTQNQMPSNLLYATTTGFPLVGGNSWNTTSYAIATKVSSANASKPFTTVLVPKQMLDGSLVKRDYALDNSFRPITPPVFSYKQTVDANNIENRRISSVHQTQTSITSTPELIKHESAKQLSSGSYKVQEDYPVHDDFSTDVLYNNKRDRIDQITADRLETEKYINYETKYDPSKQLQIVQHTTPKLEIKYGFAVPESLKYEKQSFGNIQPITYKFREFYPATEVSSIKDVKAHPLYNSAGKFEMRPSANEMAGLLLELEKPSVTVPQKDLSSYSTYSSYPKDSNAYSLHHKGFSGSHDWPSFNKYESESSYADKSIDDVDAKDVLKSLLIDMLKSKQKSEINPKSSSGMHEIIDSYFKTNRPNVDLSLDNYNIETDMSCNLRSSKHITDGHCVTTKPVVEAVCADRCLVYASASPVSDKKQRSTGEQVEALHCVDGDSKLVRVQLKCRDGNTLNNVVKVVTNCRCKLHPVQPQVRSNGPSLTAKFLSGPPSRDVMDIAAAGNF